MDDSDFDPERTEYTFEPGDIGGETDESQLARVESLQDFLKEEYELIHGNLDPEESRRDGKGTFIKTGDPAYKNMKQQLFQNIIRHDGLASAVGELELRAGHGHVDELPSFGR